MKMTKKYLITGAMMSIFGIAAFLTLLNLEAWGMTIAAPLVVVCTALALYWKWKHRKTEDEIH